MADAQPPFEAFEFVGNVEGGDLVNGRADVVVTDGFTGNITLKVLEGTSQAILGAIRDAALVLGAGARSAGCC